MVDAARLTWPLTRATEAIEALGRRARLARREDRTGPRTGAADVVDWPSFERCLEDAAIRLSLDSRFLQVTYDSLEGTLGHAGPALIAIEDDENDPRLLAIVGASARRVTLLAPDGSARRISQRDLADWLGRSAEQPVRAQVEALIADADVVSAHRDRARRILFRERLQGVVVGRCCLLGPEPAAPLWRHFRAARLPSLLVAFGLTYVAATLAWAGAWWLIGRGALGGRLDAGTLTAWTLLLLSFIPLSMFASWFQGAFVIGAGGVFKSRLLAGALRLDPDDTRGQGIGRHLARVVESESVEALVLSGGLFALAALFELGLSAALFLAGGMALHLSVLFVVTAVLVAMTLVFYRHRTRWTDARLGLTHDLVERMVGHRTRLVQEPAAHRHDDEDRAVESYVGHSRTVDRTSVLISSLPRLWLLLGMAALTPAFVAGSGSSGTLAVALGGILMAYGALAKLTPALAYLAGAANGWREMQPLFAALRQQAPVGVAMAPPVQTGLTVTAKNIGFAFSPVGEPVLRDCGFEIKTGDRIRLTGESGAGKSTLVSLLTGLRSPASGMLLLDGLDRNTLGAEGWRRRIAAAPQFHENHIFNETLAFNLLMGRRWPPRDEDLSEADEVCRRLGLGPLLDAMPAGLFQVVGETGWQLSHGERSRVFMARVLLHRADLLVLDESFAELDPESLCRALKVVMERAPSLLIVAHA